MRNSLGIVRPRRYGWKKTYGEVIHEWRPPKYVVSKHFYLLLIN
jgi:hypothetical protein